MLKRFFQPASFIAKASLVSSICFGPRVLYHGSKLQEDTSEDYFPFLLSAIAYFYYFYYY